MHEVTLLINAECAHCRHYADCVADLAEAEGVAFAAVDLARHPEAAAEWGLETSPILVVDGRRAYRGVPDARTLHELLA